MQFVLGLLYDRRWSYVIVSFRVGCSFELSLFLFPPCRDSKIKKKEIFVSKLYN